MTPIKSSSSFKLTNNNIETSTPGNNSSSTSLKMNLLEQQQKESIMGIENKKSEMNSFICKFYLFFLKHIIIIVIPINIHNYYKHFISASTR